MNKFQYDAKLDLERLRAERAEARIGLTEDQVKHCQKCETEVFLILDPSTGDWYETPVDREPKEPEPFITLIFGAGFPRHRCTQVIIGHG